MKGGARSRTVTAVLALLVSESSHAVVTQEPLRSPKHSIAGARDERPTGGERWKEGVLLVRFKPGTSAESAGQLHRALAAERTRDFPELDLHLVKLPDGLSVEEGIQRYRADPRVAYAEPDYRVRVDATPNDPLYEDMWALHNNGQTGGLNDADIDAREAWNISTGSSSVVVAVIDTGIDTTHPDLLANLWVNPGELPANGIDDDGNGYVDDVHGINTILGNGDPWDDHGHGTHVAGTIGAVGDNGIGVVGVNWDVRILSCKFLDANGTGDISDAVECLQYIQRLRDGGVAIVASNNSWGGSAHSQALADAIDAQREILCVAAAGNDLLSTDEFPHYPATYDLTSVISVAASDPTDGLAGFSNFGRHTVQIAAPGESILSTLPATNRWGIAGGYGPLNGTSMATPHVAGVAALLKGADPSRDWRAIRSLLLSGGDPLAVLDSTTITGRRLNARGSLGCSGRQLFKVLRAPTSAEVGVPVTLRVLSITCGFSTGPVSVTTSQGETFDLADDGVAPDAAAGDGVFTGTWTPMRYPEKLDVESPTGDATIRVPPPYIGHYLAEASTRVPYSQHLTATGTVAPIGWSIVSGRLPDGLGLNGVTGEISGQPTALGTARFTVRLSDAWGVAVNRDLLIRVDNGEIGEDFARSLHEGSASDARAIEVDASGNAYVLGNLGALAIVSGAGAGKNYLAKYDASGALVWLTRYDFGLLRAIALDDSGAIYAVGGTTVFFGPGDTLLVKFDPSGAELWTRTYDTASGSGIDVAMGVAVDPGGDIYLGGISEVYPMSRMYLQKLDASGNPLWSRVHSNGVADSARAVDCDGFGNVYLGGDSATAIPDGSGGYAYHYDSVVRKYDPSGNLQWSRSYDSGSRFDFLSDLDVTASGDAHALVDTNDSVFSAFLTLQYSAEGALQWTRTYDKPKLFANGLAVDRHGGVYATGASWGEIGGDDWDFVTLKYDRSGNLLWKKVTDPGYYISSNDGDFPQGVAVDANGRVWVAGRSYNGVDGDDMLLVRYSDLSSPGEPQDLTAARGPGPEAVTVEYSTGCGATDHVVVWGTSPISASVSWTGVACSRGNSGSASFDPGAVAPGRFVYFVVVAQDAQSESSYGRSSAGQERTEAVGLGTCDKPVDAGECTSP